MSDSCGGCPYHKFPYDATPPIIIDGKSESITFKSKDDVWKIIDLLIKEVNEENQKGNEFDVAKSISSQLPFFTCRNVVFDKDIQKDIQRYIYCTNNNVPPYKGSYDEQPAIWVDRFFYIKSAFAKRENQTINKQKKDSNGKR